MTAARTPPPRGGRTRPPVPRPVSARSAARTARAAAPPAPTGAAGRRALDSRVAAVVALLERLGDKRTREEMETRYGIVTRNAFGVPMGEMQKVAKSLGQDHELALALWKSDWYEARMVAAFVDDPALVTPAQMDRWCRDFDNWGLCDTVCFKLFDRTPHAMAKVAQWSRRNVEFEKRAAFALLASVALHDKAADDAAFTACLPLIERAATDERNFVKKGVSWALRSIGRRSARLNAASVALAKRLSESPNDAARWIGREALREIASSTVTRRLEPRRRSNAAMAVLLVGLLGASVAHAGDAGSPKAPAAARAAPPAAAPCPRSASVRRGAWPCASIPTAPTSACRSRRAWPGPTWIRPCTARRAGRNDHRAGPRGARGRARLRHHLAAGRALPRDRVRPLSRGPARVSSPGGCSGCGGRSSSGRRSSSAGPAARGSGRRRRARGLPRPR